MFLVHFIPLLLETCNLYTEEFSIWIGLTVCTCKTTGKEQTKPHKQKLHADFIDRTNCLDKSGPFLVNNQSSDVFDISQQMSGKFKMVTVATNVSILFHFFIKIMQPFLSFLWSGACLQGEWFIILHLLFKVFPVKKCLQIGYAYSTVH